jgi:uncharacterized protein (DUF362 family)/ferredoxin
MKNVCVSVVESHEYDYRVMQKNIRNLLECLPNSLPSLVKRGDRVLVKPHLRHGSVRDPATRLVSHPIFIQCIVEALIDIGAHVVIGDEGSSTVSAYNARHSQHNLSTLIEKNAIELVNFRVAGASIVRSGLIYPRNYWITNAALNTDFIINCGNAQPHPQFIFSGAVKNMFNVLVGDIQNRLHVIFRNPKNLARIVASVCKIVRPGLSLLDMTTVNVPVPKTIPFPVGLVLASEDPVALDTVAIKIIGYEGRRIWTSYYGHQIGLGCASFKDITVNGSDIGSNHSRNIPFPIAHQKSQEGAYEKITRLINATVLHPHPIIVTERCTGCGDCQLMCPTDAIKSVAKNKYIIQSEKCIHCGCCNNSCEHSAVEFQHNFVSKMIRNFLSVK